MQRKWNKDIEQLLKVRSMRLENLQNKYRQLEQAREHAESKIEENHRVLAETQVRVKSQEDEHLKSLMTEKSVRGHHVVKFTKLQLHGIRRLLNAESDIQGAIREHERCQEQCWEAVNDLKQAEKNIIKLEEMNKLLWKSTP